MRIITLILFLISFNSLAQFGSKVGSNTGSNDVEYILWCDTVNGEYETIIEERANNYLFYYDKNGNSITLSPVATLGACNPLIQVCDTCIVGEAGTYTQDICAVKTQFYATSGDWTPSGLLNASELKDDVSGYTICDGSTPVAPTSPVGNAVLYFDFSSLPECAVIDSINIEVTGTPNGGGYGLYAFDGSNNTLITTANGNEAEYQQYNANTGIISAGGVTFTPAQPTPQASTGQYTVTVPYVGLTQSQIDNYVFAILIQNSTDIIRSVVAKVVYTCDEQQEVKYINTVIDTRCQQPIPIQGEITIAPTPPQEECAGEYFQKCDDVDNNGVGEVLYYEFVTTCFLNGNITTQFTQILDDNYQPYTPVNPTTNCDVSILPPVDKTVLCDDGNDFYPFVQFSYVTAGNVIVTNQTELDEMTPYTVIGSAVVCPEKQILDKKCYKDTTHQQYFNIFYSDLTSVLYTVDGLEVKPVLTPPDSLIEVCCDKCLEPPVMFQKNEACSNVGRGYVISYFEYGIYNEYFLDLNGVEHNTYTLLPCADVVDSKQVCYGNNPYFIHTYSDGSIQEVPSTLMYNWCDCTKCYEGFICLPDEQLGTDCAPYTFTALVMQSGVYGFSISEPDVASFLSEVNTQLNALGLGSFELNTYNLQANCTTLDGGYILTYKGTDVPLSFTIDEDCFTPVTGGFTEVDCEPCGANGTVNINQTKETINDEYLVLAVPPNANGFGIIYDKVNVASVTVSGGSGANNAGGNQYTITWNTPIVGDYSVFIQSSTVPQGVIDLTNAFIPSEIVKTPTSVSYKIFTGDDGKAVGNGTDEAVRSQHDIIISGRPVSVVTNVSTN